LAAKRRHFFDKGLTERVAESLGELLLLAEDGIVYLYVKY
jgi:hypothetical protein